MRKGSSLKFTKGRVRGRLRQYNKFDAVQREILRITDRREEYLRGEITFVQAKGELRELAIERGIVKSKKSLLDQAIDHIATEVKKRPYDQSRRAVRLDLMRMRLGKAGVKVRRRVLSMTYDELATAGGIDPEIDTEYAVVDVDTGELYNPYWYH